MNETRAHRLRNPLCRRPESCGSGGKSVHIRGYEEWTISADGLIAESKGHFDEAEYHRQLK